MSIEKDIQHYLDMEDEKLSYLAKEIWEHPEIGLHEAFAAKLLSNELDCQRCGADEWHDLRY